MPHRLGRAREDAMRSYDVIVIGGGPAGLSAALMLGRCRRRTIVFDSGRPRNRATKAVHGFFTRDNTAPLQLLKLGQEQLAPYGIKHMQAEVRTAKRTREGFKVTLLDGEVYVCKKILIATGVADELPMIEGASEIYGKSLHHCPYCDGWEWRDRAIGVIGKGKSGVAVAKKLLNWSADVILLTNGSRLSSHYVDELRALGVPVSTQPIQTLVHLRGYLQSIKFRDGRELAREVLFFSTGQHQRSRIAEMLGCEFTAKGTINTTHREETCVTGVYAAGDASRDMQMLVVAAAEGTKAAIAVHEALLKEEGLA